MVTTIAAKDLTELVRDGRLVWAGGIVLVLLLTALAVGWQRQREVAAERAAAQALDYDDWAAQPGRHPHTAAHQGMHVFKPDPPLSIVDPGINPYVGSTIWLQAHRQSELKFRPAQDATGLQRFGELSPAWVLQVLGPLLVIVLGFNAFAAEKERGTLRQTLSLGVRPLSLLWGKALALLAAIGGLLAPAGIAAAGAVAVGSGATRDVLARLAWLGLGYGIYLAAAIFVVLAVSARVRSSRLSLVVLLGLWIVTALLAPRVASDLARTWHPSPSRLTFNSDLDAERGRVSEAAWLESFGVRTAWSSDVPLDRWGKALQIDDHAGYGVIDKHFGRLWETFGEQQRAQEWLGIAVPLLSIRAFSMGITGTDFAHHRDFSVAAEAQRRVIQDIVSKDLIEHADARGTGHFDYAADTSLWSAVPRFDYRAPPASWALGNSLRSLSVLTAGLLLAMAVAHLAVRRPVTS
jgi:ABC-2 type transport system permease protein